ncbi:unnamed protein product [Clavelina lepadiformis]|uniref:Anaphase-promoting complex subunit 7 n=1 Tax=Clavelina lepadiformis TaxID=159417 RepID=A0ABP0GYH4_CLALP
MNSGPVMEQLRKMHMLGLYTSTELLSSLMITMAKNCHDFFTMVNQCEMLMYNADFLFENKEYQKAEAVYHKALQLFKSIPKGKQKHTVLGLPQGISDIDIKFKIHKCCILLNNDSDALSILESISQKQRSMKVSLCLAKLYQKLNLEKQAVACYKEVLRNCPLALDCAIELLQLGEHPNVVISIMNINCSLDWLVPFIKAHGLRLNKDLNKSVVAFEGLTRRVSLNGNVDLLCSLASSCYHAGNTSAALQHFKSAVFQNPYRLKDMDLYAYLLSEDDQNEELEKLALKMISVSQHHPEPWIALGYHAKSKGDFTKAMYLATRATDLNSKCVQALLLKGVSLCKSGEVRTAVTYLRHAMLTAPNRLDCYAELVNAHKQDQRNNEALNVAKSALDAVGCTPDAIVLWAWASLFDSSSHDQVIRLVERALSINPDHRRAIEIRCMIADKQKKYDDAIKVLLDAIQRNGSSIYHTMLADFFVRISKFSDAVEHYNISLSINPNSAEAKAGLDKIESLEQSDTFEGDQDEELVGNDQEENRITGVPWPHDDWF